MYQLVYSRPSSFVISTTQNVKEEKKKKKRKKKEKNVKGRKERTIWNRNYPLMRQLMVNPLFGIHL